MAHGSHSQKNISEVPYFLGVKPQGPGAPLPRRPAARVTTWASVAVSMNSAMVSIELDNEHGPRIACCEKEGPRADRCWQVNTIARDLCSYQA